MQRIRELVATAALMAATQAFAVAPDCRGTTGVQALVCTDAELALEEEELAFTLSRAGANTSDGLLPALEAGQRAWKASREACVSDTEPWACIRERNLRRMAELEVRYRLIDPVGTGRFACDSAGKDVVTVTYFSTALPMDVAIASRDGSTVLLFQASSASGARYVGPGVQVWAHQGDARVRWGLSADDISCRGVD